MTQSVDLANAINSFVKGCKTDGTWDAIKACCIMAAWDGLDGALYPLKGPAPTNFNFVAADYNRETGLVGDGSTKYLNSNRNNNADPQNSKHISVWASQLSSPTAFSIYVNSSVGTASGRSFILRGQYSGTILAGVNAVGTSTNISASVGFIGASRGSPTQETIRVSGVNYTQSSSSSLLAVDEPIGIFARSTGTTPPPYGTPRISFYSIGESLDLALLDNRVSTLMTDIGAAIP